MKTYQTELKKSSEIKNHKHAWIVTSVAIVMAITLLIIIPDKKSYSLLFAGIAGGHLIIALFAIFAGWLLIPQKLIGKIWKRKNIEGYDFGWSTKWINGFLAASILVFLLAVHVYISLAGSPIAQFIVYTLLLLLSVNFFMGNVVISNSNRTARLTLPMVNLLPSGKGSILDAGCGAGRTTIALGKVYPEAKITSFDRFDAEYIESGGTELLRRNIKIANIEDLVTIEKGDITNTQFADATFDAIVSSFMIDHLRNGKQKALQESYRILKPGGKFLMVIIVPGYSSFAIANFLSLFLTSRKTWKKWIEQSGFTMVDDGKINEGAYFYFEKPLNF